MSLWSPHFSLCSNIRRQGSTSFRDPYSVTSQFVYRRKRLFSDFSLSMVSLKKWKYSNDLHFSRFLSFKITINKHFTMVINYLLVVWRERVFVGFYGTRHGTSIEKAITISVAVGNSTKIVRAGDLRTRLVNYGTTTPRG